MRNKVAGRPPKSLTRKLTDRGGLMLHPNDSNNIFELYHNNPEMFKAIAEGSKRIDDKIKIAIEPEGMKMIFENKNESCDAIVEIDGRRLVGYYCKEPLYYICDSTTLISKINQKKRGFEFIKFFIKDTRRIELQISFIKGANINQIDTIDTTSLQLDIIEPFDYKKYSDYNDYLNYPLSFIQKWSTFKETINGWKKETSKDITFTKDIENSFTMSFRDGTNKNERLFANENEISLKFNSDRIVAIRISILSLLCISLSNDIADTLHFYLPHSNEDKKIILFANIDEAYVTKKETIPNSASTTIKYFLPKNKIK